ncbi:hypothetical protein E4U43_008114 [Claviceps pusilla]|uniref:Protein PBN1 n=1 Tax=Claviceps pusilla TaxID=123648 RepID=A0A9P7NBW8_9HYPO|nr:hypothetical protein E4U43_008114 [Claviceps pusilla]
MRERITFVHQPGADIDPTSLKISQDELRGPSVTTAREDRLTIAVDELPTELARLLARFRELSLRWTSPWAYDLIEPFVSRTSPGLHVSYTLADTKDTEAELKLCHVLRVFGLKDCASNENFTTHGEGQFVNLPGAILHQSLEHLSLLTSGAARELCTRNDADCQTRLEGLSGASSLDISWHTTAQVVRISAVFSLDHRDIHVSSAAQRRTEIGILSKDSPPSQEPYELGVSGLLTVLGENKEPTGTMFAFPSRHRSSEASFTSQFLEPAGLHPVLQLKLSSNEVPVTDEHCAPHVYLTLPNTIFADRYQLADKLFLASNNLTALRYTSLPVDLEAPAYATKTWGSTVLLELAPPPSLDDPVAAAAAATVWTAQVPLHLRYLEPSLNGTADIEIPYPVVFWACDSSSANADFSNNPFDRIQLGYDGLFGSSTVFWHVKPEPARGDRLMSPISVPVLKEQAAAWVGAGTAMVVAMGFAWVFWTLTSVLWRFGYGGNGHGEGEVKEGTESKKSK